MDRTPVQSSHIRAAAFDAQTATLEIEFASGAVWQYPGTSAQDYANFMRAPSKGSWLHQSGLKSRGMRVQ